MANHVMHSKQDDGVPVLGSAYVRFDPVPEGWEDIVPAYEEWEESHENEYGDRFHDPRFEVIRMMAETLAKGVDKELGGGELGGKTDFSVRIREGSFIVEIFMLIPLIDLLCDSTLDMLRLASYNKDLDAREASKVIGQFITELVVFDKLVRKIAFSLNTVITAIVGNFSAVRPEARVGIIQNIITLNKQLDVAKLSSKDIETRAEFMCKTSKQLKKIKDILESDEDRELIYQYLLIRARDLKHLDLEHLDLDESPAQVKKYNDCVDEVLKIRDSLSSTLNF